ncbi:MAG: MarR family winged helix-turn-helix transcriptional regulator [Rubrimonas sp.]|uniref:MarR family winged helix-turn-helix transcriptional regulator n=1 Tax=Rubrimonas sp. TaxID=2036015 RepID=UPI002FDCA824
MAGDEPDPYILDAQVGYVLRRAHQRHTALFAARMEGGLTPTQFAALSRLAEVGPCSQNHLGRLTAMDVATIKGVVDRLRARGLVASEPDAEDRRRSVIALTEEGRALIGPAQAAGREITEATLAPLTARERATLLRLLRCIAD